MLTFEQADAALAEMVDDLPPEIFTHLNCGVSLTPQTLYDENGLLILGQYHYQPHGLGRYVNVHYGSMVAVHGHKSEKGFRKALRDVLHHELTHHLECMAGDKSLEIQDAIDKARYLRG